MDVAVLLGQRNRCPRNRGQVTHPSLSVLPRHLVLVTLATESSALTIESTL